MHILKELIEVRDKAKKVIERYKLDLKPFNFWRPSSTFT